MATKWPVLSGSFYSEEMLDKGMVGWEQDTDFITAPENSYTI